MGRPSNRDQRREEIVDAFARVLADHGYAGATIAAIASEAGVAPGLLHHHFASKQEILESLLQRLVSRFRARAQIYEVSAGRLEAYVDGALKLDDKVDLTAARCWVGLFAEAIRNPALFKRVRALLDAEIEQVRVRSQCRLNEQQAGAVLAFIVGALVVGAFAPRKTAGFAAPALRQMIASMTAVA